MCENHKHARVESWITPEDSQHLSAKMVQLFPGEEIPWHTTGPGREEVLVVIYGSIEVARQNHDSPAGAPCWERFSSGEAVFIPANCNHAVANTSDTGAQYAYTVTKRKVTPEAFGIWAGEQRDALQTQIALRDEWEDDKGKPTVADCQAEVEALRARGWTQRDFAKALKRELTRELE